MRAILFSLWMCASAAFATFSIQGVELAQQIRVDDQVLQLDGAGLLRWKGLFKVYVAAHYRETPGAGFDLQSDEAQALEIAYLRDVPPEGFVKATRLGLSKTLPAGEQLSDWQPDLDRFLDAYRGVAKGDRYQLGVNGSGFHLALNGQIIHRSDNAALGRRLLGVWLAENSPASGLRADLLALN